MDAVTALCTYTSKQGHCNPLPEKGPSTPTNPMDTTNTDKEKEKGEKKGKRKVKLATLATRLQGESLGSSHNPQPPPFSLLSLFQSCNTLRPWLWPWMDTATSNSSLTTTQRRSSLGDSTRGAQLRRRKWRNHHVGSINLEFPILLLMQVLVLATNMVSLAAAMPMAGREPVGCGAQEGLWSQAKCQVASWSGVQGGRGGLRLAQAEDGQVRTSLRSSGKASLVTTCGLAYEGNGENGELEKVGPGAESGIQPIQFESGQDPPTVVYAPNRRIVAIGDLHGDIERTQWALQLAGVLSKDGQHRWTGGTTVLVQVGDVLDRGEDEIAILSLLAWLGKQARSKGGAVFQILGNHETMNVAGDFRYVAPGGFQEAETFVEYCEEDHGGNWDAAFEDWYKVSQELKKSRGVDLTGWLPMFNPIKIQKGVVARTKLLSPGGPLATQLAAHGVVLKVNDWLFAHGGVLPHHVDYGLERMNKEVSLWMKMGNNRWGQPAQMPFVAVKGFDSIVWSRLYSKENFDRPQEKIQACGILAAALAATNCRGLIVGHTPQTIGANCKCDGRIWRIDVGMSSGVLHALPEVLEIVDDKVRILSVAEEFLQEDEESPEELTWKGKMEVQNYRM